MHHGNDKVVLCLRGIRTFDSSTRFTYDIGSLPVLRQLTHLPIVVDPSHAAGKRTFVSDYAKMAIAAQADGLIIETHYCPQDAKCDGAQMITPKELKDIVEYSKRMNGVQKT